MRSVNAGVCAGALWGALFLLGGCAVSDVPPVSLSKPLLALTPNEYVALCDWAIDYLGGYDYKHPESTEDENTAVHVCPPTQEDLGLPEDNPRRYTRWDQSEDGDCKEHIGGIAGLDGIVDDFVRLVYAISERPCVDFALELNNGNYYFLEYEEEEAN